MPPPSNSDFYQQRLKAWQPILTPKWVIITFLAVGIPFIVIGIVLKRVSDAVVEVSVQYDGAGTDTSIYSACHVNPVSGNATAPGSQTCTLTLTPSAEMQAPVYLYYQLSNFYQNHRRYVKSRSDKQLAGNYYSASSSQVSDCSPLTTIASANAPGGQALLDPCGLIAYSVFNDTFTLTGANPPQLQQTGIAWPSDLKKFVDPTASQIASAGNSTMWLFQYQPIIQNVTNEHFIVWMRTAALPTFRKLYGRIDQNIPANTPITIQVAANYPVTGFEGKKAVVLSTASFLGGKNPFLGLAYIVVGAVCVGMAILFAARQLVGGRRLGDTSYLTYRSSR